MLKLIKKLEEAFNTDEKKVVYKNKEGVSFWAAKNDIGQVHSYVVLAQADGFPASEAYDDWFANYKDADEMAKKLSLGLEEAKVDAAK